MASQISPLSMAAAGFYCMVLLACAIAAFGAKLRSQPTGHLLIWLLLALLFALLIMVRLGDLEELFRAMIRANLRGSHSYAERRTYQRPLAAGAVLVFSALGLWAVGRMWRRGGGRRNLALGIASLAALGMVGLVSLRLVSLHAIDAVLYGPFKLNWFADLGFSMMVAGAALYYVRLLTLRPK